jgi:hypothetical protein
MLDYTVITIITKMLDSHFEHSILKKPRTKA